MADDEPDWKKLGGGGGVSAARNMFKQKEAEAAKDAGSPGSSRGSPGSRSPKSGGIAAKIAARKKAELEAAKIEAAEAKRDKEEKELARMERELAYTRRNCDEQFIGMEGEPAYVFVAPAGSEKYGSVQGVGIAVSLIRGEGGWVG